MRHTYTNQREKRVDFWLGFAGWIVFNVLAVYGLSNIGPHPTIGFALSAALILINIAGLIVLAFTRGQAALGILFAFATAFSLAVAEGVFLTVSDFVSPSATTGSPTIVNYGFLIVGFVLFAIGAFFVLRSVHRGIR
ncbi:MAG: hypothetical protein M3R21_00980 [Candidatus Dormibacteraeota bacterium]|nr:hypothetical protein [Candidatus Dormibacteraeota bacterium]